MDLYALPPAEFTAARDAEAKQARAAGERDRARELTALRRPTASAHAVNALVRADPDLLGRLLDLGAALAQAQQGGQGEQLRALGDQRRQLVEAVADRAAEATGAGLGPGPRSEVVATLEAALADPASAEAVRSGRLVRALSYAGFGGVDLDGAVAAPPLTSPPKSKKADTRRADADTRAAEQAAQQAHAGLDDAVRALDDSAARLDAAVRTREAAEQAVTEAEAALHEAREERTRAQAATREADGERAEAATRVERAQAEAERTRAALDRLRRG